MCSIRCTIIHQNRNKTQRKLSIKAYSDLTGNGKGKGKDHPITGHQGPKGGVEV
jgi:hypothetical protein